MLVSGVEAFGSGDVYPVQMSWIDVAIASLVVIAGLRGWSQGLLRHLGAFLGRIIGLVAGCYLAVSLAPRITAVAWRPLDIILIIGVSIVAGGLIMRYFGGVFSVRIHESRLGIADSVLGASVGVVGMLVTCWFIAAVLAVVPWSTVGQSINRSLILRNIQRVLPSPPAVESRLQGVLSEINVPSLFANVVAPTLPSNLHGTFITKHHVTTPTGVVSLVAYGGCNLFHHVTGFVVAPGEVATVAHALAGEKSVQVQGHAGQVVLYDPRSDLAVVKVAGLSTSVLALGTVTAPRSLGEVVGYQTTSDRVSTGALVLGSVTAPGRDIYSGAVFSRTMDVVVAPLTTDESGAPVMVNGVVRAIVAQRAVSDTSLNYAIPVAQLRAQLSHVSPTRVSTQRCIN
jgi:uncharacterized membrane protein required for colicin V production